MIKRILKQKLYNNNFFNFASKKDLYNVLGAKRGDSATDIKKAYF